MHRDQQEMSINDHAAQYADMFIKSTTWALIVAGAVLAGLATKLLGGHVHVTGEILFAVLMALVAFRLGKSHFARDIREIACYNLLFQGAFLIFGQIEYLHQHGTPWLAPISHGWFMLFIVRLYWCAKSADQADFVGWPVFGLLGWFNREKPIAGVASPSSPLSSSRPSPSQTAWAYGLILLCFPSGYALHQIDLKFLELSLFGMPVVIFCLVKNDVFNFFDTMRAQVIAIGAALGMRNKEIGKLNGMLQQSLVDAREKVEDMRGYVKYVAELSAAMTKVVSITQQRDHAHAETEDELDEAKIKVDELLLAIEGKKMPPDIANLVAAYEQIKRDVRPDFIRLAQSIAHSHPIPTTVALHLVRSDNDPKKPD